MIRNCFLFLLTALIIGCSSDDKSSNYEVDRPIDPWVFRSVLDSMPRMLTAALDDELYVAYHTNSGALYKAWKGIVNFEGAVYNTQHGPQPTALGDAYIVNKFSEPWSLLRDGNPVESNYKYLGHRFNKGSLELMHGLVFDGTTQKVFEKVEAGETETGQLVLERTFTTEGLNAPYSIQWKSNVSSVVDKSQAKCDGTFEVSEVEEVEFDGRKFQSFDISISINETPVTFDVSLIDATILDPKLDDGFEEDDAALPRGAQLIAKNDCKTCHNKTKQTVGPSYTAISKRYEHSDENVLSLVSKIKKGGTGVWGSQVMTPHPEIPDFDVKEMVNYIFTLAEYEGAGETEVTEDQKTLMAVDLDQGQLIPGALTRVYSIPRNTQKMPSNLDKKEPIMAGVLAEFNNLSGGSFKELEDDFALTSKGFIHIDKEQEVSFRLWSDDGSKLYIHDDLVIDHDGLHGTSMRQVKMKLSEGYHPFKIEFFQGSGGKFLSLNYKLEGKNWQVVPSAVITHHKDDHVHIGDLSLPMSVVTKIPGDAIPLADVHPSFDLHEARPIEFTPKVGGMDFTSDGRLLVSTWTTEGEVYSLTGGEGDNPDEISYKKIAFGLAEPLGLKVIGDRIFVLQKQELTELVDTNGDEVIDEYRTICNSWGVSSNFHEFCFGLVEKDGYLYANLATGILPGGAGMPNQHPDRGSTIKISIEDGSYEMVANGLRTPNGIGIGYNNDIFVADNQGDWLPSSKILHIQEGDWFGSRAVDFEGTADKKEKLPVVWLPQDEIGNSPSTPLGLNFGPYQNQMMHGEVTHGGLKRVFVEEVNGELQGCVFRFVQGLEAGVNRTIIGPDGHIYVGGIGNPGNWQHSGTSWYGLQRLEYNDKSTFEMLAVRAMSDGIEIEFTEPLKENDGWQEDDYEVRQWYYLPTADYGGPKLDNKPLNISSINVSDDRRKVFLELEGMKEGHVIYVRLLNHFVSSNENSLWSTEAWYTMNQIPTNKAGTKSTERPVLVNNQLTEEEIADGWKLLFDGKSFDGWKGYKKESVGDKWVIENGTMSTDTTQNPDGSWGIEGSNDIITVDQYENFEFNLEWKIQNCGNSGIFFLVQELDEYHEAYFSGPEMQILDNVCHVETNNPTHRAGDLYDLLECKFWSVKSAGEWNKVRLIVNNGKVEHWLNGHKVVEYELWTEKWNEMIANSKFKDWPMAKTKKGHLSLQEHDDKVWFRNIKIKEL